MNKKISNTKGLVIALLGALFAQFIKLPLPWLLGPLITMLLLGASGIQISCDIRWRKCGQIIIGMTLGLYFTSQFITAVGDYWLFILIGLLWAVLLNIMLAWLQFKVNHLDWATAWFSSSIGSASEMVNMAEKYNAQADKVVASHSLRIVLLVVLVPLFMGIFLGVDFSTSISKQEAQFQPLTVVLIFIAALIVGKLFDYLNILNAWLLGPLCIIGIFSFTGILTLKLPNWLIYFGQLCIGWSLGTKFPFDFLQLHKRFIAMTIGFNTLAVGLSLLVAWLLTYLSAVDLEVMILGFSPGGIAEMSLTAKAIGITVPVVVAFQLIRLIFVIVTTPFFYRFLLKRMM
ncbi:AbrB family transcriptional regulator [Acinetobacter indicus]|uniref:AbrB family transcriptional regulator n=1 Tax=Acinetobacter indicus TaxID=756892 RepID=UPI000948EE5F|nr:AbrB family transcriptional regulator [Acinetobacter indicus]MDM1286678.1 AbrB family transcriptional regulator [Acinetobacter indicus]